MEIPCQRCENFNKTKEVIDYDCFKNKLFLKLCPYLWMEVPEKELNETEKKKLDYIRDWYKNPRNNSNLNFFTVRNRIYTNGSGMNVRCRIPKDFNVDLLSDHCPFYIEMFVFSENFKKNSKISVKNA